MDNLWAPWRMEFIAGQREDGCVFCKKPSESTRLRENLVLYVGDEAFVILNRFPYQFGHLMVVPRRHTADFESLTATEGHEIHALLQRSMGALREAYRPEGFNVGMNLGQAGGAGIRDHLHYHVVARWLGDANFFPLLSGTRSMPELLLDTYDRLRPAFDGADRPRDPDSDGREELPP